MTNAIRILEDTGKKDQGQAFMDEGSPPPPETLDEGGPTIMATIAPVADEDGRTYKTSSK
jgi:hypothetical protein